MSGKSPAKEQIEMIHKLVDEDYTIEQIAKELDMAQGTVNRYVTKYNQSRTDRDTIERLSIRPERTPERLKQLLNKIPGVGETKADYICSLYEGNPLLRQSPQELYNALVNGIGLTHFLADNVVKTLFADVFTQNPQAMYNYYPPQGQGGGMPQYPQGQNPMLQAVNTPSGPVYLPAPAAQQGLSRIDIERILADREREQYIEEVKPLLHPVTGQPVLGPDGQLIVQKTKRPVNQAPDPMQQMMGFIAMMKGMNDLNGGGSVQQQIQQLQSSIQALANRPGPDPAMQQMQQLAMDMQVQNAKIMAQMEGMRQANETAQRYSALLWEKEKSEAEIRSKLAIAQAGMSAHDQVSLKVVESGMKGIEKALNNNTERMDRVERVAVPFLRTMANQPPSVPLPTSPTDLANIANQPDPAQPEGPPEQ